MKILEFKSSIINMKILFVMFNSRFERRERICKLKYNNRNYPDKKDKIEKK